MRVQHLHPSGRPVRGREQNAGPGDSGLLPSRPGGLDEPALLRASGENLLALKRLFHCGAYPHSSFRRSASSSWRRAPSAPAARIARSRGPGLFGIRHRPRIPVRARRVACFTEPPQDRLRFRLSVGPLWAGTRRFSFARALGAVSVPSWESKSQDRTEWRLHFASISTVDDMATLRIESRNARRQQV